MCGHTHTQEEAAAAEKAGGAKAEVDYEALEEEGLDCTCHTAEWCDRVETSEDLKRCVGRAC
jgi:hypothetical protein